MRRKRHSEEKVIWDIEAVLFAVWDNRQLGGLKNYVRQLGSMLNEGFGLSAAELRRAQSPLIPPR